MGPAREVIGGARAAGRSLLTEPEAAALLSEYGVPVVASRLVRGEAELDEALRAIPPPWVMKIVSPVIVHKTDIGGVILGVGDGARAREALRELEESARAACPGVRIDGVLVQPEVRGAVAELLLGAARDEQFGPVVLVGLGGVLAEAMDDTALRVAPVGAREARAMLGELRGSRALGGFRGRPAGDVEAVARAIAALSRLAAELEDEVAEVDVNPLLVLPTGDGAVAVDALVRLAPARLASPARED